jgi:hypothetical protein
MTETGAGVTVHDPERCFEGYTLYCESYEDPSLAPDGTAEIRLVDMEGEPAHTWPVETAAQSFLHLRPDGRLLYPTRDRSAIEAAGLRELAPDGEVQWHYHCRIDHDYQVLDGGNLLVHTIDDHMVPELGSELRRNPYLLEITPEKELVREWRGEEHVDDLRARLPAEAWDHVSHRIAEVYPFDWAHNNASQVIGPNETYAGGDGDERFAPGNVVFSYRSLDTIGVIDWPSGEIVWAWGPGTLDGQHKPHVLDNGNVLVFDNGTERGYSRVIEVDPLSESIEWEYVGTPEESFYSPYISGAQRLPGGNTLICEGGSSRLFEVTPDGDVVWEFLAPHREGGRNSVYRCRRYAPEYVEPLLEAT